MAGTLATSITINAQDNATNKIRKVADTAADLCSQLEAMGTKMSKVFSFAGLGAGVVGISSIGGAIKDVVSSAARYETLGLSMEQAGKNAGYSTAQMREFEQQLQRNGIAMQESRQTLTQLAAANVDLSKAADLARASQDLAVVAGLNSSEAFEKLVHGAVGGQVEVLRNLGLMVDFETEYSKMASSLGKTADKLSEAEKLQARLNVTLEASTKYSGIYETAMTTAGKQLGTFTRHVSDMKTMIGEVGLDALAYGIFGVNSSLEDANKKLREWQADGTLKERGKELGDALRWATDNAGTLSIAFGGLLLARSKAGKGINDFVASLTAGEKSFQGWSSGAAVLTKAELSVAKASTATAEAVFKEKEAVRLAALEKLNKAKVDEAVYAAMSKNMGISTQHEASFRRLTAVQKVYATAAAEAAVAQNALSAAQGKAAAAAALAGRAGSVGAMALGGLKSAGMGLVNLLGGPWMAALTVGATAVYAMATADSHAEREAKKYGITLGNLDSIYHKLSKSADEAAQKTDGFTRSQQAAEKEAFAKRRAALEKETAELRASIDQHSNIYKTDIFGNFTGNAFESKKIAAFDDEFKKLIGQMKSGELTAESTALALSDILKELDKISQGNFFDVSTGEAKILKGEVNFVAEAIAKIIGNIEILNRMQIRPQVALPTSEELWAKHISGEKANLDEAYKRTEEAKRNALQTARNRAVAYLSEFKNDSEYQKKAQAVLKQVEKEITDFENKGASKSSSGSSGGGAARRIDQTASALDALKGKVDELRGKLNEDNGETYLAKLNKELADYERNLAKMSGKTKEQYAALIGDYRDLGGQYAQKERDKEEEKRMQVRLDFQRQYADMAGLTSEAVARSLQKQYDDYRKSGVDITQLEEWKADKIRRASRAGFDGATRAMQDYHSEATNLAKSLESLMGNSFQGVEDAWVKFTTTGKLSFTDMANSVIADLSRIAAKQALGSIVGSLAKGLTGLFSSGVNTLSSVGNTTGGVMANEFSAADNMYGIVGGYHSGGVVGRDASFYREYPAWMFAEAPRYHKGGVAGFRPGEIPAILQYGEEVLTRNDPRHRNNMRGGGLVFQPQINIINASSEKVTTQESTGQNGQPRMDIIIGEIDKALAQKIASGKSQIGNTFDKTRGLNTSNALYMK